jgi:hypothetical protein
LAQFGWSIRCVEKASCDKTSAKQRVKTASSTCAVSYNIDIFQ